MVEVGAPVLASTRSGSVPCGVAARWSSASSRSAARVSPSSSQRPGRPGRGRGPDLARRPALHRRDAVGGRLAGQLRAASVLTAPRRPRPGEDGGRPGRGRVELVPPCSRTRPRGVRKRARDLGGRGARGDRVAEQVAGDVLAVVLAIAPSTGRPASPDATEHSRPLTAAATHPSASPAAGRPGTAIAVGIEARSRPDRGRRGTRPRARPPAAARRPRARSHRRPRPAARRSPSRRARRRSSRRCAGR